MALRIYGYAGCTTVKKARDWAASNDITHDYMHFAKADDLDALLRAWVKSAGIDAVFNAKAQTLKKMDEATRSAILASDGAKIEAMHTDPRLIKRPVGTNGQTVLTGFDEEAWKAAFA
ncbi:MAG: ArsC/Spx/MgsR family protein [Pseudomonadota bacterium]